MTQSIAKKLIALCAASATLFGSAALVNSAMADESANTINISDTKATDETRALFANLRDTKAGDVRFGQQHATDEAISETATQGDVYEMTGKYPAVFGWDVGLALEGNEKPGSGNDVGKNIENMAGAIKDADAKGAIVTLSAHWNNPKTGGAYNDTTRVVPDLLPGGAYSAVYNKYLDNIAGVAKKATRADGVLIPIIFRPLHENNGSWFWWGAGHATADQYKELFRYTVDYLRDVQDVHNFLYSYSPGGVFNGKPAGYLKTYPGDDYVDVLGYDDYTSGDGSDNSDKWIASVVKDMKMISDIAAESGKVVALTEFGRKDGFGYKADQETKNKTYFSDLRDALTKEVPSTAYMLTWANFGGSGNNFQAYTPWKGQDAETAFQDFAKTSDKLWASPSNVDYSNVLSSAKANASARIVTPVNGTRLLDNEITIRVKTNGIEPGKLIRDNAYVAATTADGKTINVPLTYSCNGYFIGKLNLADNGITADSLTLTPQITRKSGKILQGIDGGSNAVTIKLGEAPKQDANVVDDFDHYDNEDEMREQYSPNHGTSEYLTLIKNPEDAAAGNALNFHYDFNEYGEYTGYSKSFETKQDWSMYEGISLYYKPDGSDHKLVIQMNAGGVTFEAYPSLTGTEAKTIELPFDAKGNWNVASWDTDHADMLPTQKLLSKVGSFAIYVNDNDNELQDNAGRPRTGDLVFDSIKLIGERDPYVPDGKPSDPSEAKPISLDDFEGYADDEALRDGSAWGNRGARENYIDAISLGEEDGNKFMEIKTDFPDSLQYAGWMDNAKYLNGQSWAGLDHLQLRVKNDQSDNAMVIQLFTTAEKQAEYKYKLDSANPAGWTTLSIPLGENGFNLTADDLASMKEIVIAANDWHSGKPMDFAVDDIKVTAGENAESPKPENPDVPDEDDDAGASDNFADVADRDPATCPVAELDDDPVDEGPSDPSDPDQPTDTDKPAGTDKPADANKPAAGDNAQSGDNAQQSNAKVDENKSVANTGSSIAVVAAVAVALVLAGAATLVWARQRRQQ